MEPTISIGDVVIIKETEDIKEQDIISFNANNAVITHRVVEVMVDENNEKQYKTKGDANSIEDTEIVKCENIIGKYCFKIPNIGNIIMFLRTPLGIGIIIVSCILILVLSNVRISNKKRKEPGKHTIYNNSYKR